MPNKACELETNREGKRSLTEESRFEAISSSVYLHPLCITKWGFDLLKVKKEASQVLDRKWISNQKQELKKSVNPSAENFEALATFKQYVNKEDKLLVYRFNDKRCNPDIPSYVFKTSKVRMQMARNMDRDCDHFLNKEFCYFDGKVKRCRNYVTLTASVYHPMLKRQIPLAVMEAEREDSDNIELFWKLFNEALRGETGQALDGVPTWPEPI